MDLKSLPVAERKAYLKILVALAAVDDDVSSREIELISGISRSFGFRFDEAAIGEVDLDKQAATLGTPELREILLDDLVHLAERDGGLDEAEQGVIKRISAAWAYEASCH